MLESIKSVTKIFYRQLPFIIVKKIAYVAQRNNFVNKKLPTWLPTWKYICLIQMWRLLISLTLGKRVLFFFHSQKITQPKINSSFSKATFLIFLHLPHFPTTSLRWQISQLQWRTTIHGDVQWHTATHTHTIVLVDGDHNDTHPGLDFIICCVIFVHIWLLMVGGNGTAVG